MAAPHVAIVGSGVAGAIVAQELLQRRAAGHITMLEAGGPTKMGDYRSWLDFLTTKKLPYDDQFDTEEDAGSAAAALSLVRSRLIGRGGSTNAWVGFCPRFKPEDFRLGSATGRGSDWPITYADLEPFYHDAENLLAVAGDSDDDEPPRLGKKFPYPAAPFTLADGPIIRAFDALAYSYSHLPIARNGDRCMTTGTCDYCPVDARYAASMSLDDLESAYEAERFELRLNSAARRIVMRDAKSAIGVEYLDKESGETRLVEADVVIICAGAIESPKLLLASADRFWPRGIGNDTGHVGRHLIAHPMIWAEGTLADNPEKLQRELNFSTLCSRHFDTAKEQQIGKFFFYASSWNPTVKIEKHIQHGKPLRDIERIVEGPAKFALIGFIEEFEVAGNSVGLAKGTTRFGLPKSAIVHAEHDVTSDAKFRYREILEGVLKQMGCEQVGSGARIRRADHAAATCRTSGSQADGVVDRDLRVHGTDNIYICSNAVFPNVAAVNPTLTLTALALRLGASLTA